MKSFVIVVVLLCAAAVAAGLPADDAAGTLAQTERDFARMSVEQGMYKAFVKYAADNGIQFAPHPRVVREAMSKQAEGPMPDFTLDWRPMWTNVSRSGDIGFNAGPWIMSDNSERKEESLYGYFLSVWKKQPDGAWRFIIDAGVRVSPFPADRLKQPWRLIATPPSKPAGAVSGEQLLQSLRSADAKLLETVNGKGMLEGYRSFMSGDVILYRQGRTPATDLKAAEEYLAGDKHTWTWKPIETGISNAGDFGYLYGSFDATPTDATQKAEKGYYLRIWTKNAGGQWRLAADVIMPRLTPQAQTN